MVPKLLATIFSKDPRIDLGSSSNFPPPPPAGAVTEVAVGVATGVAERGCGDEVTIGFLFKTLGGDTEGVLVAMETGGGAATDVASKRLRSAMEGPVVVAVLAGGFNKLGPTHCLMWSTKRCMRILSPHFSHAMRPAGSLGFTMPLNSCCALSNSNSFLTGKDFFLFSLGCCCVCAACAACAAAAATAATAGGRPGIPGPLGEVEPARLR